MTGAAESSQVDRAGGITLDDLRRQRGEGWQWARAQTDRCPQCGHHPAAMEQDSLGTQLMESAGLWRIFLLETDDSYLRTVPAPGIFSPMQYGAHVRDILRVYGDRILIMLEEDSPVFPQFNPEEIARESMGKFLALHDQFHKTVHSETAEQEAKSRDHGHDSEIRRSKQPCQDHH